MSVNEKMTAIADAIRDKTGGTDALTLDGMATEIPKVYEAGKQAQNDEFWDNYQKNAVENGDTFNLFAGPGWNINTFYPKHNLILIGAPSQLFLYFSYRFTPMMDFAQRLEECRVTLDTSRCTDLSQTFRYMWVTRIPKVSSIGTTSGVLDRTFAGIKATTIDELELKDDGTQRFSNTFQGCENLVNIMITGTIGGSGFDIHYSTKLSRESLLSILQACKKDNAGVTITLPLKCIDGATNTESYISGDTELSTALSSATAKGYTVNFD